MISRSLRFFALCCLGLLAPAVFGQNAAELGRLPAQTAAAIHIKSGAIYASPVMKDLRDFIAKAGPRAMENLTERFQITPFQIDRITGVVFVPDLGNPQSEPPIAIMISTLVDIKTEGLAERLEFKAQAIADAGYPAWVEGKLALAIPEPRLAIVGEKKVVEALAKGKGGAAPAAFADLQKHDLALIANLKALPPQLAQFLPEPFVSIAKAETVKATIDLDTKTRATLNLAYASDKEAIVAEDAIKDLARKALAEMERPRQELLKNLERPGTARPAKFAELPDALGGLLGLAMLNQAEDLLKNPPLKRDGSKMTAMVELEGTHPQMLVGMGAIGLGLTLPAVQKVRSAASRSVSANNLKQLALAFHNYAATYNQFPGDIVDKKTGKPLLSWRVALLPYIEQNAIYQQFKLDEPWDSENNLKLAKVVVKTYAIPTGQLAQDPQGNFLTHYQALKGKNTLFEPGKKLNFPDVTDGTSNTIMFVEAKNPVIWTKPEDIAFDPAKDLPAIDTLFGGHFSGGFNAAFGDGSVRFITNKIEPSVLKAIITRNGGEVTAVP